MAVYPAVGSCPLLHSSLYLVPEFIKSKTYLQYLAPSHCAGRESILFVNVPVHNIGLFIKNGERWQH